jgi:hypothetical protein
MSLKPFAAVPKTDREWQAWLRATFDERLQSGAGSPEGVVVADRGTIYMRTDGAPTTTMYIKGADDGLATGWSAVTP